MRTYASPHKTGVNSRRTLDPCILVDSLMIILPANGRPTHVYGYLCDCGVMFQYGNNDRSTRSLPSTFHDWLISNYCVEDGNAKISLAITLAEIGRKKRGPLDQRWLDESLMNSTVLNPLFPHRRSNRCAWARGTGSALSWPTILASFRDYPSSNGDMFEGYVRVTC